MEQNQIFFQNLLTRIAEITGEFSNNFKAQIINTLEFLNAQNNDLCELNVQANKVISAQERTIKFQNMGLSADQMIVKSLSDQKECLEKLKSFYKSLYSKFTSKFSKKSRFYSTFRNQSWSLPDTLIYYITKNPATSKYYKKIVKSCKHFFIKNPIIIVEDIWCKGENSGWSMGIFDLPKEMDKYLKNLSSKIWITEDLSCLDHYKTANVVSSLFPKIYRFDAKSITLEYQKLSFNEFRFLCKNVEFLSFVESLIKNEDDTVVALEKIVETVSKVKDFHYTDDRSQSSISTKTVKNLLKIPHFSQISICELNGLTESFDIDTLYYYAETNEDPGFELNFYGPLSNAFKNRLEEKEALKSKNVDLNYSNE